MTAATSTLSASARRALRAAAHHLDPVVMVGQHGLTPAVLHEIDLALTAHALIKVRVMSDEREIRVGFLNEICQKMGCESVQHLGKLLVLWRNAAGDASADDGAEQDAATVKAGKSGRGPRTKLPAEWANADAPQPGDRPRSALPPGERRRYGEIPPAPRREGWAPKDRRGAARAGGEEALGTRRREEKDGFAATAPRGRAPYGDGASRGGTGAGNRGGYAGGGNAGGGSRFGNSGTGASSGRVGPTGGPPRSRSGYGGNTPASGSGFGGGGGYDRSNGGASSGSGYGGGGYNRGGAGDGSQGGGYGRDNDGGAGAPRARWGDRREPADGRSGGGSSTSGGYGGGGNTGGGFSGDRRPAPAGGGFSARGGAGNRDGVTGKPSGFTRSGTGAGGGAPTPRTRRRMG